MSTFGGQMSEIPEISIDRFDGINLNAEAYFLSHCHTDHMIGLNEAFVNNLITNNRFMYLSHISAEIIKSMYPKISENLIELDMFTSTVVVLKDRKLDVIPISAGHCPGSVMFLFETGAGTILYTGDFRVNPNDLPKFNAFRNALGTRKRIDALYVDTTFFLKAHARFPTRAESLDAICTIISDWIGISDKHVIGLQTPAKYGYEYLFMEIYKRFKMPIHVNDAVYEFYRRVPKLDQAVTRRELTSQIHSACGLIYWDICPKRPEFKIKTIRITAWRWGCDRLENGIFEDDKDEAAVCYSTHPSYEETVAFIKFLKPKRIEANVLRRNPQENHEIEGNIKELLDVDGETECKKVKLFEIDAKRQSVEDEERQYDSGDSCVQDILDSPPRRFADS